MALIGTDPAVQPIDGHGAHANDHLLGTGTRIRHLFHGQGIEPTVTPQEYRFHSTYSPAPGASFTAINSTPTDPVTPLAAVGDERNDLLGHQGQGLLL